MARDDFIDFPDGFVIRARGWSVDRITVEPHQFRLYFLHGSAGSEEQPEGHFEVVIESSFRLRSTDGTVRTFVPGPPAEALGPALAVLLQEVEELHVSDTSDLRLTLANGPVIEVDADPDYEAWEVHGPDGLQVIGMPGGGEPAVVWGGADTRSLICRPQQGLSWRLHKRLHERFGVWLKEGVGYIDCRACVRWASEGLDPDSLERWLSERLGDREARNA